jgi:hypothetical protein
MFKGYPVHHYLARSSANDGIYHPTVDLEDIKALIWRHAKKILKLL